MAIKQHDGRCFYLPGASQGVWEKLTYMIKGYERIENVISITMAPFIFQVHPSLRLERIPLP